MCVASSTLFLLNAALCYYYGFYVYFTLFTILTITSILFHTTPNSHPHKHIYNIIDKSAVLAVVLYGAYTLWTNWHKYTAKSRLIIIGTFLSTIILFSGGYMFRVFCYHPVWGNMWHSLLHIVSVVGHGLLVIS